jgi:hypothetical protein
VSPERYKRIAFAFRKRIRHLRAMNNAFWNGDLACPGCGRDTNNARCRDCMCGVTPDTSSHVKARAEGYKQGQEDEREALIGILYRRFNRWFDTGKPVGFEQIQRLAEAIRARGEKKEAGP